MKCYGTLCLIALLLAACGGGDLEVYNNYEQGDASPQTALDAGASSNDYLDQGTTQPDPVDPGDAGADAGAMADVTELDMDLPGDMTQPPPTTNAPQEGPTVEEQVRSQCSTIAVKGLSLQLIEQMNCLEPGIMKSFEGAPSIDYGPVVFPFLQGPATDTFKDVAASYSGTIPVNSALRTLPQQYLLYRWYQLGLCNANLAASPGRSNHNGGLAIDISNSDTWRSRMRNNSFIDNVSGEPWHFYYNGAGGRDVRNMSVLAFQKLYNLNFPENPITEDGLYGPQTEGAMKQSPANGFTREPMCPQVMALSAYDDGVPLELDWVRVAPGVIEAQVIAPTGIRRVEYFVDGERVGESTREESNVFRTRLRLGERHKKGATIEVVAFDAHESEVAQAIGGIDLGHDLAIFARPLGGDGFEIGVEPHIKASRVEVFVDGELVEPVGRRSFEAVAPHAVKTNISRREDVAVDVVVYDARGDVVQTASRTFDLTRY